MNHQQSIDPGLVNVRVRAVQNLKTKMYHAMVEFHVIADGLNRKFVTQKGFNASQIPDKVDLIASEVHESIREMERSFSPVAMIECIHSNQLVQIASNQIFEESTQSDGTIH